MPTYSQNSGAFAKNNISGCTPQHLFVAGLHRSGTTLLSRWIAEHPDVSGLSGTGTMLDEGQFLQDVFPSDVEHGGPGRFGFDVRAHLTEDSELLSNGNCEALRSQWSQYWDSSKPVCLEKSPSNILRARFLQSVFPDARFVFLLRHPIAVTLATHKWSQTGFLSLVAHWVHVHQVLRQDLQHLNHWLVMPYESLIYSPDEAAQCLQDFLGLSRPLRSLQLDPNCNQRYFTAWDKLFVPQPQVRSIGDPVGVQPRPAPDPWSADFTGVSKLSPRWWKQWLKRQTLKAGFGDTRLLVAMDREAEDAVARFESEVRSFGYSLLDTDRVPATIQSHGGVSKGIERLQGNGMRSA